MAPSKPLSKAERARIVKLHGQGLSRNAIAKEVGRSLGSVTAVVKAAGLTFPQVQHPATVAARELSVRERTIAAHERHLRILELQQGKLLGGYETHTWRTKLKGAGGAEHVEDLDFIPSDDEKNLTTAMTSATAALKNLTPVGDAEKDAALSVVEQLTKALGIPDEAAS